MSGPITLEFVIKVEAEDILEAEEIADELLEIMGNSIKGKYWARVADTTIDATEFED